MKAFNEISFLDFKNNWLNQIKKEVESQGKDYILKVDEDDYAEYLEAEYRLIPLEVDLNSEHIAHPTKVKDWAEGRRSGERYEVEAYKCTVSYNFTGSALLFKVQSNPWTMTSYEISVDERNCQVSFNFNIRNQDPQEFRKLKDECFKRAFTNLPKLNQNVSEINNVLENTIRNCIKVEKQKYLKENDFFAAINVKVNSDTQSVFTAPTLKRKIVPQPQIPKGKEFASEPAMSREMYYDVLKVVYDSGKSMEKKPALYIGKDEEGLRDQFLFVLETRYVGVTATGETFNRSGKTDILLKYAADGSNLFVAECKFWHGASEYHKAISQLFDRYLTWRDSKVAIMMFVPNSDFTKVLNTLNVETQRHPYFKRKIGERGESSFSYEFHLPNDEDKTVYVEVMAFHYDK
ncbi:hypothetical protein [Pontibacter mangrovi]|uniref:Uncharacterized protein n=1 Tax=Pontibacter mangrovi TaxID=2589816 RepID=A0A501W672_9BACT|nr:hypothetical protein [Pontibacter mangrovi]TPE43594.1 hypothetical protein FJM65_12625 [Pontibacter mangrovi]